MRDAGQRSRAARRSLVAGILALVLAGCAGEGATEDAQVRPIDDVLASDIEVEAEPSGTTATLTVETELDLACAVVYGPDEAFGSIATDADMAGGAHREHAPQLVGLEPATEYQYVLQGSDAAGNLYRSDVMTFRTPEAATAATPGPNVAPEGEVAAVSSEFSDAFAAENAVDGDLATEWSSDGDGDDASITLELAEVTDIVGVRLRTREMSDGSSIVRDYTVTIDGAETFGPFPADETAELSAQGSQVRFDAADTTGGNTGAVEVEVYADAGG